MEELELICFNIISNVGMARGSYIEAIDLATEGKFDAAVAKIEEGNSFYVKGHEAHADLIAKEASGERTEICLVLVHAEDQMMSAEGFKILAEKFIALSRKLHEKTKSH